MTIIIIILASVNSLSKDDGGECSINPHCLYIVSYFQRIFLIKLAPKVILKGIGIKILSSKMKREVRMACYEK